MLDIVRPVLALVLTAGVLGGLAILLRRSAPARQEGQAGTIRPDFWTAWLTVAGGLAMFVTASRDALYGDGGWGAAAVALIGAAAAGFMAPSTTSIHAVHWNDHGVEGPAKMFGPTLGLARTEIAWPEIAKTGKTKTAYWYVESGDGRRVTGATYTRDTQRCSRRCDVIGPHCDYSLIDGTRGPALCKDGRV